MNMKAGIIALVVIVAIVAVYFLNKGNFVSNLNDSELTSASTELDNTDIDSMDSELNQNNTDASTF